MSQPTLPSAFQALETRLSDLQARYQRGELDAGGYQTAVQELKVKDSSGRTWWLGGEAGAWQVWDGKAWVRAAPQESGVVGEGAVKPRGKGSFRPFALGCGVGVFLLAVLGSVFLLLGWRAYQQEPLIVEGVEAGDLSLSGFSLSSDQQALIDQIGYPEAFSILFYEEALADGSFLDIRDETWSYYTLGMEYTFINGEKEAEDPFDIELSGELAPIPYKPDQFVAYMSLDEVIASAGLETYMVIPLEKEYLEGGEVYYAAELTFGLVDDELLYVEALALEIES